MNFELEKQSENNEFRSQKKNHNERNSLAHPPFISDPVVGFPVKNAARLTYVGTWHVPIHMFCEVFAAFHDQHWQCIILKVTTAGY